MRQWAFLPIKTTLLGLQQLTGTSDPSPVNLGSLFKNILDMVL